MVKCFNSIMNVTYLSIVGKRYWPISGPSNMHMQFLSELTNGKFWEITIDILEALEEVE